MSYFSKLKLVASELDSWQRAVLASMCAQSVKPFITYLARDEVQQIFSRAVGLCWLCCLEGVKNAEIGEVQREMKKMPEALVDDSNMPAYDIMFALSIVSYALDSIALASNAETYLLSAASGAADAYAGVDSLLSQKYLESVKLDPSIPSQPGLALLEESQIELQFTLVSYMRSHTDERGVVIDCAKTTAKHLDRLLNEKMNRYLSIRGWIAR